MRVDIGAITNLASSDPSGKFKDPDPKANITCLGKTIDNVSFTRFPQICPDAPPSDTTGLPRNGADPGDIRQGRLGDCYFLSAISCLASHPELLRKVFVHSDPTRGIYVAARFFKNGSWYQIAVDDFFPTRRGGGRARARCSRTPTRITSGSACSRRRTPSCTGRTPRSRAAASISR